MLTGESLAPQLVDKVRVDADTVRIDVEVARLIWSDRPGEKRETFENVSEGKDEAEACGI